MQSFCRITCLSPLHPLSSMSLYFLCLRSRSSLCICECLCHWFNVFCTFFFFSLLAFHTEPHFSIDHHAQLLSLAFLQNLSWSLRNFIELHPRSRFLKSLSCFFFFTVFGLLINRHFVLILVPNLAAREEEPKELEESKATPNHSSTSTLPQHVHKTREVFFFAFFTVHRST